MVAVVEFRQVLREARRDAGISQAELARRARTSQSRVSSYEAGSVVPSTATRTRLLAALRPLPSMVLDRHRRHVVQLARSHRVGNVRVFGSIARGEDTLESDVDLLVTPGDRASLLDFAAFAQEVEDILGYPVDVTSDRGLLPGSSIARDAVAL